MARLQALATQLLRVKVRDAAPAGDCLLVLLHDPASAFDGEFVARCLMKATRLGAGSASTDSCVEMRPTVEATTNRIVSTPEMDIDRGVGSEDGLSEEGAQAQSTVPELRWKVGHELPPFISSNQAVVELLKRIVDGGFNDYNIAKEPLLARLIRCAPLPPPPRPAQPSPATTLARTRIHTCTQPYAHTPHLPRPPACPPILLPGSLSA